MFLIYRNRSANIGIEMKLKKHLSKMIKDKRPFLAEVWLPLFQAEFLPLWRKPNFYCKKGHFFNQLIFNDLS
jgi:hypothetical protein